mmetsp:Transcript_96833/g.279544  ORF Transcript_96833/g.279544 Transcript_96833/m.279544 type:complete len:231 (-) Transcript_96833:274-966(-)
MQGLAADHLPHALQEFELLELAIAVKIHLPKLRPKRVPLPERSLPRSLIQHKVRGPDVRSVRRRARRNPGGRRLRRPALWRRRAEGPPGRFRAAANHQLADHEMAEVELVQVQEAVLRDIRCFENVPDGPHVARLLDPPFLAVEGLGKRQHEVVVSRHAAIGVLPQVLESAVDGGAESRRQQACQTVQFLAELALIGEKECEDELCLLQLPIVVDIGLLEEGHVPEMRLA